ncbi:MAG: tetratricopeptide repeat protein [Nanoarchaeota archaeon]
MKRNKIFNFAVLIFGILIFSSLINAEFTNPAPDFKNPTTSFSYLEPNFFYSSHEGSEYWPILKDIENGQCTADNDFFVMIPPGGCTPAVVRSDLLEEQNVPVFCQLSAVKVNPLIKVSSVKSISFKGNYSNDIVDISFHPARAGVKSYYGNLLGSPLLNNIGYVVIVLKKNKVEKTMPDWVMGNLTATIYYDAEKAFGTGNAEYYSPILSEDEWKTQYGNYGFWQSNGFLRVSDIQDNKAKIVLYTSKDNIYQSLSLKEGETSNMIYFPGFYCKAGLQVKLNKIVSADNQAKLNIDGNEIWVRKGSKFLDNKCSVTEISVLEDYSGTISINCNGEKINLILQKSGALISINNDEQEYDLGDSILNLNGNNKLYFAYSGKAPANVKSESNDFILLAESSNELKKEDFLKISQKMSSISKIKKEMNADDFKSEIEKTINWISKEKLHVLFLNEEFKINEKTVKYSGAKGLIEKEYTEGNKEQLLEEYFKESDEVLNELLENYPYAQGTSEKYAEESLWNQFELAERLGKQESAKKYLEKIIELYPESKYLEKAKEKLIELYSFNYENSFANIYLSNDYHYIKVENFDPVNKEDKNVYININGETGIFGEGENIGLGKSIMNISNVDNYFVIDKIDVDELKLSYKNRSSGKSEKITLNKEDHSIMRDGKELTLIDINVKKYAYISLIPKVNNAKTNADFSFKIGIEKRGIQLSPERTKEMLNDINEQIKEWDGINQRLNKLVQGMQGTCLGLSSILILKNTLSGFSGESLARQKVMQSYRAKCDADPQYGSSKRTQCYNDLADSINSDVEKTKKSIEEYNSQIKELESKYVTKGGFFGMGEVINNTAVLNDFKDDFKSKYGDSVVLKLDDEEETIKIDNIKSFEQLKELYLMKSLEKENIGDSYLQDLEKNANVKLAPVIKEQRADNEIKQAESGLNQIFSEGKVKVKLAGEENLRTSVWDGRYNRDLKNQIQGFSGDKKIQAVTYKTNQYILVLRENTGRSNYLGVEKIFKVDGIELIDIRSVKADTLIDREEIKDAINELERYVFVAGGSCKTHIIDAKVQFYELEPNKNLPAIVPFDVESGWYAKVPQTINGVFSSEQQGYLASGDVSFFYICNVGENGLIEGIDKDICRSFDINSFEAQESSFAGCTLSSGEIKNLYENAIQAIRDASRQYGNKEITILGKKIPAGTPISGEGEVMECQDFMSPEECMLLFNVCDPVVCPVSRCNFGGKFAVQNVVQSGIIGSIALCLPNFNEGVMIPVCLTGIHAGIDSYVSLLKSERECLQKSLDSGEKIGVCDEITSIYTCEFFWRNVAPFMQLILPKAIESAYGLKGSAQSARGGGEYLTVMNAWENSQKSVDYFKNNYAQTMFRAFELRNVEQAGSEACKMFVGTSFPTSAKMLNNLLEPESPVQFNAWFSEIPFTEATTPATSQYKIYYHIYAGNDTGVQYSIYLKNPPATSYYSSIPQIGVKNGYIARGESADETLDLTAPAGYKELCVVINTQEYCGFKQVSTSFAVNYVADKVNQEQINRTDIDSEKECISGSPSILGALNPNVQAGIENSINPQINLKGIVRICASDNPGKSVEPSRWVEVGNCGNSNLKCWLDTNSVEDDLSMINAIDGTNNIADLQKQSEKLDQGILSEEDSLKELGNLREESRTAIKNLEAGELKKYSDSDLKNYIRNQINSLINNSDKFALGDSETLIGRAYSNNHIAEAISLKLDVYRAVVDGIFKQEIKELKPKFEAKPEINETNEETNKTNESGAEIIASQEGCKVFIGNKIIDIAKEIKKQNNINDEKVLDDTGSKNFECLVLQIAYQESLLQHCKKIEESSCLYCDDSAKNVLKAGGDEESYGVMQVNKDIHKNADVYNFENNVNYAIKNVLIPAWNEHKNEKVANYCGNGPYSGWRLAIRYYNGYSPNDCRQGDADYVEKVIGRKETIQKLFPDECGEKSETFASVSSATNAVLKKAGEFADEKRKSSTCWTAVKDVYDAVDAEPLAVYSVGTEITNPITKTKFCFSDGKSNCPDERNKRSPVAPEPGDLIQFYNGFSGNIKTDDGTGLGEHNMIVKNVQKENDYTFRITGFSQPNENIGLREEDRRIYIFSEESEDKIVQSFKANGAEGILTVIWEPKLQIPAETKPEKNTFEYNFFILIDGKNIEMKEDDIFYRNDKILVQINHNCNKLELKENKALRFDRKISGIDELYNLGEKEFLSDGIHKFYIQCFDSNNKIASMKEFSIKIEDKDRISKQTDFSY